MFLSSAVLKTIAAVSSVGGLAAAGVYGVFSGIIPLSKMPSFSVVVEKKGAVASGQQLTLNKTNKNYKCKFSTTASVDCLIVPIAFTDTKTSFNITDIKAATLTDGKLTNIPAESTKAYYKVEVDSAFFDNFKDSLSTKSIEVVDANSTASEAKILTLQPILAIDDANVAYFDKSVFIVDTATLSTPASLASEKVRYCSFITDTSAAGSDAKKCHITDLGTSISTTQDFAKPTAEAATISTSNHYLVNFLATADADGLPKSAKTTSSSFYVEQGAATTSDAKTKIATFPNANIHPTILVDSATTGKKNAFVLKTN